MVKAKTGSAYRRLTVWMLVLLVLFALAGAGYVYVNAYLAQREDAHAKEVAAENEKRLAEYNAAVAERNSAASVTVNDQWPTPAETGWDVIDLTAFTVESAQNVSFTRADMIAGGLLVVNRWHELPADFNEGNVVSVINTSRGDEDKTNNIPAANSAVSMLPTAVNALMKLYGDARALNLEMDNIVVGEAYRSMATQTENWNKVVEEYQDRYKGDALTERARQSAAYPGTSDYQAGLSCYLYNYKSGDSAFSNTPLHETEQGRWIYENSWKYGFVFRFPVQGFPYADSVDKSYKTGINLKNHKVYRYVGEANAAAMHALDMCLEEYVEYLMTHPHIAVYADGALKYEIFRTSGGYSDQTVGIPRGVSAYSASSDNLGGLVVAVSY